MEQSTDKNIRVINALDFPKPKWNLDRKMFQLVSNKGGLHADANAKIAVVKDRYHLILQRLKRTPLFSDPRNSCQLTAIDALIGSPGHKYVFGYLSQLKEGKYCLEDPKGHIEVDISQAQYTTGIFVEGAFVLVEGEYLDSERIIKAQVMYLPVSEGRQLSLQTLANLDIFAPPIVRNTEAKKAMSVKYPAFHIADEDRMEVEIPEDSEIVVLSDVHLDNPQVLNNVQKLFQEFEEEPPSMIILCGNFCSSPSTRADNITLLKQGFDKLAEIVHSFPRISSLTHFVIIPGPTDPGGCVVNILPNNPLPGLFTQQFREKVKHFHITSNPARIRFYGQDIVIFREDLVNKMKRHAIKTPTDDEQIHLISQHLVKTICDQSHLCPLNTRSVYWNYDHTLYLYPLPDTIILADKYDQFNHTYDNCLCVNPGSFATDFSFVIYSPADRSSQFQRID